MPQIRLKGFADIQVVPGDELIESLSSSYSRVGMDETMVITRSNKRANIYNQGIRNMVLDREDELCRGDILMIVKNNYYWVKETGDGSQESGEGSFSFIANGDRLWCSGCGMYTNSMVSVLQRSRCSSLTMTIMN